MDSTRKRSLGLKSNGKTMVYGASYTDVDPVLEQSRRDLKDTTVKKPPKKPKVSSSAKIQPSMSTRVVLQTTLPHPEVGRKYTVPKTGKQKKEQAERRKKLEEDLGHCTYDIVELPPPITATKRLNIKLEAPSAEISSDAKVMPQKPSITASVAYPEPPKKRDLKMKRPKSGVVLNKSQIETPKIKRKKKVKKSPPPPLETTLDMAAIEEMMARELATIEEQMEGEDYAMPPLPETYLTKQFRKCVSQISKTTSIQSKDLKVITEEEEEDGAEEEMEEEEDRLIDALVQKFRRDSEQERYEPPKKRKIKHGTFESHSFTKLKQPTLKTFYFGVKQGTIHQGDDHFPANSRNRQTICMPCAAYCYSILKHPDKWTQADIDAVLESGNALYLQSATTHHIHHGDTKQLHPHDLHKYCTIGEEKIRFTVSEPIVSGMVRSDDRKIYNLTKAINVFFGRHSAGILTSDNLNVAIWRDRHFYFFDAAPRTIDLFSHETGVALMANFYDTTSVLTVLLNRSGLGNNPPFTLYAIQTFKIVAKNVEEVDSTGMISELDNYRILNEEKAVVTGSFDLADKCFGFSRDKQAWTMGVVALVYSKITPASCWHKTTIDKIMIIGNQLFLECIQSGDDIDTVGLDDVPGVFTIGPYLVEIAIYANRCTQLLYKKGKCQLLAALEKFFETNTNALLQIDRCVLAVWQQRGMLHLFDPYSRNGEGRKCRDGTAAVSMYSTVQSLCDTVSLNFDEKTLIFHLHALKVCKINRDYKNNNTKLFPKNLTMNDYPMEDFKKCQMLTKKRGPLARRNKPVSVDYVTRASMYGNSPEVSLMEVGSNVKSLTMDELPAMVHKFPSKSMLKPMKPSEDFVADLDSPSLSDTQIEPVPLEGTEGESLISLIDLDAFALTQEELELQNRGEGEDKEQEEVEVKEMSMEEMAEEMEDLAEARGEEGAEEWYMAATEFTQVGSHSLMSQTMSEEVNTDVFDLPFTVLPPARRAVVDVAHKKQDYDFDLTKETDVTLSEELQKATNFVQLPDNSQIVLGTKNLSEFGDDLELMAPFVAIMATVIAKKYSLATWSKDIIDYVLKCGSELHATSNTRFDQVYKLEIAKITLGHHDFSVQVDYVFDTYLKAKILEMAITKMLFTHTQCGILVTPTYSCALFYKHHLFYLFDGFGSNEVGLGKGPSNKGVAFLARFTDVKSLIARILHNKKRRELGANLEYNRFVLSSCQVKLLSRRNDLEEEEELMASMDNGEDDDLMTTLTYPKNQQETITDSSKVGYRLLDDGSYKIEGTMRLSDAAVCADILKADYFICLCASLQLLCAPLKRWDSKKIDAVIEEGQHIFEHADDLEICTKKFIKNILIDDYFFNISAKKVKFNTYKLNSTLKRGIETMLKRKHEHFLLQFPNRCYVISHHMNAFHLFDPSDVTVASWTRFATLPAMIQRVRHGVVRGGESYNFHLFEIMSITKAPEEVLIGNRLRKYRMIGDEKKVEIVGKPFNEESFWLDVDPIPWSMRVVKEEARYWKNWLIEFPDDLYSMFGRMNIRSGMFLEELRGKQTLAVLVVAIGMMEIYELSEWTLAIMDAILVNGDVYFQESIKKISDEDHDLLLDDLNRQCTIFPFSFGVKFTPIIDGTMFLLRLKQFNLFKALRLFFDDFERRFGIICVSRGANLKRHLAFGKLNSAEFFMYDCESFGPPMFMDERQSYPYILRTTTLNRLLHVMVMALRGGDFFIYDVSLTEFEAIK